MKQSILMRVLFCKIHCPSFICFCKPSAAAARLYTPPQPLKLENSPNVPPSTTAVKERGSSDDQLSGETIVVVEEQSLEPLELENSPNVLKSCIRKLPDEPGGVQKEVEKKKVRWMDNLGKQLVEIKEFESSETGDTDSEEDNSRGCVCTIL